MTYLIAVHVLSDQLCIGGQIGQKYTKPIEATLFHGCPQKNKGPDMSMTKWRGWHGMAIFFLGGGIAGSAPGTMMRGLALFPVLSSGDTLMMNLKGEMFEDFGYCFVHVLHFLNNKKIWWIFNLINLIIIFSLFSLVSKNNQIWVDQMTSNLQIWKFQRSILRSSG